MDTQKNDPHIYIPAAVPGPGWAKLSGEKSLGLMAFGARYARVFPVLFR